MDQWWYCCWKLNNLNRYCCILGKVYSNSICCCCDSILVLLHLLLCHRCIRKRRVVYSQRISHSCCCCLGDVLQWRYIQIFYIFQSEKNNQFLPSYLSFFVYLSFLKKSNRILAVWVIELKQQEYNMKINLNISI